MSDQQKTHESTPRKRQRLRDEGKIARSGDIATAVGLAVVTLQWAWLGGHLIDPLLAYAQRSFRLQDVGHLGSVWSAVVRVLTAGLVPTLLLLLVVTVAMGMAQTGGLFSPALALPKAERLNPLPGLKRMVPGKESAIELGKQCFKVSLIGTLVYKALGYALPELTNLSLTAPGPGLELVFAQVMRFGFYGTTAFALIAVVDYLLARRKFLEDAKMSEQELRDERRQEDGDPQVKRRIRQRQQQMAMQRALSDVKHATVLVTNPTHFAIALRYAPEKGDMAPMLLAKGADAVALKMRERARHLQVPVVEHRPLARALHADGKIGAPVPMELYGPCAEVIAHVLGLGTQHEVRA